MKRFSGTLVTVYLTDENAMYAVAEEYSRGKIIDAEIYAVDSMTDPELQELLSVGGVYVSADAPAVSAQWIKENGTELASSCITAEGVEFQTIRTDNSRIKQALELK